MHFTRLRLNGFKSFVDPTDLVIRDGLTGVVGPNGCGKSNLLEALRWVMGENRPKAMRGDGMEDVIFQGSGSRPARPFAEVSLSIDNSDRRAPQGFNDSDMLEIVRRITRDSGSAYKVAGKDVRARDVQMLFADASTGAHSPALVRQGQIAELINARPKARRRILEEAAGISGLYQRRHEAELRLKATESNLARVDDVLGNLASQLGQLARQAKQAARYRDIAERLRSAEAVLFYLRWRDLDQARADAQRTLDATTRDAAQAEAEVAKAARHRAACEDALPPLREEDGIAGALRQRLDVRRATLADEDSRARAALTALDQRIAQLTADIERESALDEDAGGSIARLKDEQTALEDARAGHDTRLAEAEAALQAAQTALDTDEAAQSELAEQVAALSARHQAAARNVQTATEAAQRSESDAAKAAQQHARAEAALQTAGQEVEAAQAEQATAASAAKAAEDALAAAEEAHSAQQTTEAARRTDRAQAEGEATTLHAEERSLRRLVEGARQDGDRLLDRVTVTDGFEAALGAALGEDLNTAPDAADGGSGWIALAPLDPAPLPEGAMPLAPRVDAPEALARRLAHVGVVAPEDGRRLQQALQPGQRLVSHDGDLWRWDGLIRAAGDAPSAAAEQLQRRNRLTALRADLDAAQARCESAQQAHDAAKAELARRAAALDAARAERRATDKRLAEAGQALSRAQSARHLAEGQRDTAAEAQARHEAEAERQRAALAQAQAEQAALDDLAAARERAEATRRSLDDRRAHVMAAREARDALNRQEKARARRAREIAEEIRRWQERLDSARGRVSELVARRDAARAEHAGLRDAPDRIAAEQDKLRGALDDAQARQRKAADALAEGETALRAARDDERDAEREASARRESRAAAEAALQAAQDAAAQARDRLTEAAQKEPEALLTELQLDPAQLPDATTAEADVTRLRRQRDALGAVNLRAEEDAQELQAEHDTLSAEKADLEAAIRTLRNGIAALNREGRERLLAAFAQVNENFSTLFTHLFGGGTARLVLVESDDPLEAGLEIMAQPPGKKLTTLSLLSGGEQTLTALALIFAVFLANPAPICVLDEVDAPLDDANVSRFCDLLDEMTRRTETRFLIITHNAITMSRMDRLFGVTMAEQGVSQLVSVDLKRAETMVA